LALVPFVTATLFVGGSKKRCDFLEYLVDTACYAKDTTRDIPFTARFEGPMPDQYNLLVYYDGSPESKSALMRVTRLGCALTATVHVLSVVDIGTAVGSSFGHLSDVACSQMERAIRQTLKEALDHLAESGMVAHGYVAMGNVVDNMTAYAGLIDADLLVLGHRNSRGLAKWLGQPAHHVQLVQRAAGRAVITVPLD
jgi:nucleotide-binding universal stress UspA family protein